MCLPPNSPPAHSPGMWTLSPQSSQWIQKENGQQGWTLTCEPGHHSYRSPQIWNKISAQQRKLLSSRDGWAQFGHQFPSVFSYFNLLSCHLLTLKFQNKILFGVYLFMLSNYLVVNAHSYGILTKSLNIFTDSFDWNILIFKKFLLKYSWFTMLCWFQVYCKVIQLYIYIYIYIFFSIMVYHRILNIVSCALQ